MRLRNVVLVGFMGAGKSTVGAALAARLGFDLIDTDLLVEQDAGADITTIWRHEGERGFRAREEQAVLRACAGTGRVIACGGGAILGLKNYGVLKGAGPVVYLRAPAEVLRARVGDGGGRPLLAGDEAFDRLLAERTPVYESAADVVVDADRDPTEVAVEVAERLDALSQERG